MNKYLVTLYLNTGIERTTHIDADSYSDAIVIAKNDLFKDMPIGNVIIEVHATLLQS